MDSCGKITIRNKCLNYSNGSLTISDCDGLQNQNFIYDYDSKTIRPSSDITLCVGTKNNSLDFGVGMEIQTYKNLPTQKFIYNEETKRFNLESNQNRCIDLKNNSTTNGNGFQLIECKEHEAQRFTMQKCTADLISKDMYYLLETLKQPAYNSYNSLFSVEDSSGKSSDESLYGENGMRILNANTLFSTFYMKESGTFSVHIINNSISPINLKYVSLNSSPYINVFNNMSGAEYSKTFYLKKGIHLIFLKTYEDITDSSFNVKIINKDNGSEYDLKDLFVKSIEGIPVSEWLYSDLLTNVSSEKMLNAAANPVEFYADVNNGPSSIVPVDSTYSKYSEWEGCSAACGFDSRIRVRELIPPLYGGIERSDILSDKSKLEQLEKCNKFCRSEEDVFNSWKSITKCPAGVIPAVTKEKEISYTDEAGKTVKEESAVWIDNLRYYREDQLTNVLSFWNVTDSYDLSYSCYGNTLRDGNILRKGSKLFSKDAVSYLEYQSNGRLALFDISEDGTYKESVIFRNTPAASSTGDYVKLSMGKLLFYKISTTTDTIIQSIDLIANVSISLTVNAFSITATDSSNYFINIYGTPPSEINLDTGGSVLGEIKFKPAPEGITNYIISKSDTNVLVMGKTKIEYKVEEIVKWTIPILSGEFLCFNSKGFYVGNNTSKSYESNGTDVSLFILNSKGLVMKNSKGWTVRYHGESPSNIVSGDIIKRPTNLEEENNNIIKSAGDKGHFKFQYDGNLVFYKNGSPVWASNTDGKTSTHMYLDVSGELFLMNNTEIVYRSRFSDSSSILSVLFVFDEWFFVSVKKDNKSDTAFLLARVYPTSSNMMSDNMKTLIKHHIQLNYNSYPKLSIISDGYSNNKTDLCTDYIDITEYLRSYNFLQCSATDFLCNITKKAETDPSNSKKVIYKSTMSVKDTKWSKVNNVSLITTKSYKADYTKADTYKYDGKKIAGYSYLISDKYIGLSSSPIINVNLTDTSSEKCKLLVKKGVSEFSDDFADNEAFRSSIINNNSIIGPTIINILGLEGLSSFKLHESFSMKPDLSSSFSNPIDDILESRLNTLESVACSERLILSKECQEEFAKYINLDSSDSNIKKRASDFYKKSMNLECRKDFNNSSCVSYYKKLDDTSEDVKSFIQFVDGYCKEGKNMLYSDCQTACKNYDGLSNCFDVNVVYAILVVLLLSIILVVLLVLRRKTTTKLTTMNANKNNTERI